jgi:hypothetical protein
MKAISTPIRSIAILIAATASALVLGTGIAKADAGLSPNEQQFVNDMASVGLSAKNGDPQSLVNAGRSTCDALHSGRTQDYETQIIYGALDGSIDQAKAVLKFTVNDLCPDVPAPTPSTPLNCGAHTDALDCRSDTSPPTAAEQHFIQISRGHYPGSDAEIVQVLRGTCVMLTGGDTTGFVVSDIAQHLGISKENADQLMDGAMEADCPNLTVGADGVAR